MYLTREQVHTFVEDMPSYQLADEPQRRAIVDSIFEGVKHCTVCGEPSVAFGPFIPERDSSDAIFRTGVPDDKHLIIWCGLCPECWNDPKGYTRLETVLADRMVREANRRAGLNVV